jgi:hypothetical protein
MSDWAEFIKATESEQVAAVIRELRIAVATRGDGYIYPRRTGDFDGPSCQYVRNDQPSCLAGVVLHALGVPLDRLAVADHGDGMRADLLARELGAFDRTARVLYTAQVAQDGGSNWGRALENALTVA